MWRRAVGSLAVLVAVVLLASGQASASRHAVTARTPLPTLLTGWYGRYTVRPTSIYYTGDGSGLIGKLRPHDGLSGPGRGSLRWTRWTRQGAAAFGTLWLKLGVPAFSPYTRFQLTLTAGRFRDGHFTRMTLHYRVHGKPQTQTWCVPDKRHVSEWGLPTNGRCVN
jgi:hypothetical protein